MRRSLACVPGEEAKAGGRERRRAICPVVVGRLLHLAGLPCPWRECSVCLTENEVVIASVQVNITSTVTPASSHSSSVLLLTVKAIW